MQVEIVTFPETRLALVDYRGDPAGAQAALHRLIAWKLAAGLRDPLRHRHYGLHYADPFTTPAADYRVEFAMSVDSDVTDNPHGVRNATIGARLCARARDIGSRANNRAADYLYRTWLPNSGETLGELPIIFHYVNVGPQVVEDEMITDVYLPLG